MDRDRWRSVNEIFDAAVELPPSERRGYVSSASAGDASLAGEVERLLAADGQVGSYLDTPAALMYSLAGATLRTGDVLQAGDVVKGRFRLVRAVGEGGMGKVFEAWDEEVKVRVALKVVRPEIAASPAMLAAFRREVRIARTITHPNVCRTYDLDRGGVESVGRPAHDLTFLTMEFLEGETLAARLGRVGALGLPEALDLARQVASALDAAHAKGIVHRDIKPANIMLVPQDERSVEGTRAVITDFGLARAESLQQSLQQSVLHSSISNGGPVGTLAYMAPEQMESNGAITPATDVFAFGLVLFEMVTGRRAFPSSNLLSGIAQRLAGAGPRRPSPGAVAPELPPRWEAAIERCLGRDPADRFASAGAVVEALTSEDALPRALGAASRRAAKSMQMPLPQRPRWLTWPVGAAVALAAMALLAAGLRLYRTRADAAVAPGTLVYLTPVVNRTGERPLDNVTELLRAGLTQSAQINLLDQGKVGDILQNMTRPPETTIDEPIAREIAMRGHAARVVFATVTSGSGRYKLDIDIQRPDPSGVFRYYEHWPKSFAWQMSGSAVNGDTVPQELAVAVREASTWIREEVGESSNDVARLDAPLEDVTTGSWEAFEEYSRAQKLFASQKTEEAMDTLRSAVLHDPKFALAHALLGDTLYSLSREREGEAEYKAALESDAGNRLSLRERTRVKGIIANDTWDLTQAVNAYHEYNLYYPHDYIGWFRLARPLLKLGRTQDSIDALKQARLADPTPPAATVQLVRGYLMLGDIVGAKKELDTLRRSYPVESYLFALGPTQFIEEDYGAARETFEQMLATRNVSYHTIGLSLLADLLAEQGDYVAALDLFNSGRSGRPLSAWQLLDRAQVHASLRDFTSAAIDVDSALKKEDSPDLVLAAAQVLGRAIHAAPAQYRGAMLAQLKSLQKRIAPDQAGLVVDLAREELKGEIALAEGHTTAALAAFRTCDSFDFPIDSREYLARALTIAARKATNREVARAQIREAGSLYLAIAGKAATVWYFSLAYRPGFYADQIEEYLNLPEDGRSSESIHGPIVARLCRLRSRSRFCRFTPKGQGKR